MFVINSGFDFFLFRSQTLQGAQCQIQQTHHPQCNLSLLSGWQSQRAPEEPDPGGESATPQGRSG